MTTALGAEAVDIQAHYDVSNAFYQTWLDPSMTYSCGLYLSGEEDIDTAQVQKLDYYVDRLRLSEGARVLDVGCGWGSMVGRVLHRVPGSTAVGLTLSEAQRELVASRGEPRLDVRLQSWDEHEPDGTYDGIVSLGAFEHFARAGISASDRIARYRDFFTRCFEWLPPEGRLCVQSISLEDEVEDDTSPVGRFFTEEVFPNSSLPRVGEVVAASEEFFRLTELRADGDHYARTCRQWRDRLIDNKEAAEAASSPETVTFYRKYLMLSEAQFSRSASNLLRFTFTRRPKAIATR
jgi:cyclopropane-fatty-acyl-phospholipid synthase